MSNVKNIAGGLLSIAALSAVLALIGMPVGESYLNAVNQRDAAFEMRRISDKAYIESNYKTLCPAYRDASFLERLTTYRNRAYCEKYLDRL